MVLKMGGLGQKAAPVVYSFAAGGLEHEKQLLCGA
jgi:hypothetical protein